MSATAAGPAADQPGDSTASQRHQPAEPAARGRWLQSLMRRLKVGRNGADNGPTTLGAFIETQENGETVVGHDERILLANVLRLRHRSAEDIMVPRADIQAIESEADLAAVIEVMTRTGHARIPVYRETLDDVIGLVHIKDVLAWRGKDELFHLSKILRRVLFVAPSMEVLQLLLEMRAKRSHLALVVDEYGGIDGLLTIEDVVEEIVGEIADEHDKGVEPAVTPRPDGSLDVDARVELEALDQHFEGVLTEEEREDVDTIGGLVVSLAGRVPIRGELISHPHGLEFEVLDADPRRIKRVRVRRAPLPVPQPGARAET